MIAVEEVRKLAKLARIKLTEVEENSLAKDMGNILEYVAQIKEATANLDTSPLPGEVRNISRRDDVENSSGQYTNDILKEAPEVKDDCIAVQKIL